VFAVIFYNIDYKPIPISEEVLSKKYPIGSEYMIYIQKEKVINNEYVKGAFGAVVGWVIKNICDFLWGLIKSFRRDKIC